MPIIHEFHFTPEPILNIKRQVIEVIERPYLRIKIAYKHKISVTPVTCLVDSGADYNLFPSAWGKLVGIPISKGVVRSIISIGGYQLQAYRHPIRLYVVHSKINFETFADFSDSITFPLLGRQGFFNRFKSIKFQFDMNSLKVEF